MLDIYFIQGTLHALTQIWLAGVDIARDIEHSNNFHALMDVVRQQAFLFFLDNGSNSRKDDACKFLSQVAQNDNVDFEIWTSIALT